MKPSALLVVLGSFLYGVEVETVMEQEALVLTRHHSDREMDRDVIQRHPAMMHLDMLTIRHLAQCSDNHQWSDINRYVLIGQNGQYCRCEEKAEDPSQDVLQEPKS